MAVNVGIYASDLQFSIEVGPGEPRERVGDDPPTGELPLDSPFWFDWDGDKLAHGEYEFLGLTVYGDLARVSDEHLWGLDEVRLPRVTCLEAGLVDRTVADVIRWARDRLVGPDPRWFGWPSLPAGEARNA